MDAMSWIRAQMTLMDAASAIVSFAANWLVQSTLLIAAGLAIGRLLRARGSAVQSAVYRTTLAAAIACPLATSLLAFFGVSGWSLEMPVAWTFERVEPVADDNNAIALADGFASSPTPELPVEDSSLVIADSVSAAGAGDGTTFAPQLAHESILHANADENARVQLAPDATAAPVSPEYSGQAVQPVVKVPTFAFDVRLFGLAATGIALAWLAASAVLLARLLRAWRRLHQLRSDAAPAELAAQETCRELAALLIVSAPELLRSPYLASPCLAGLRRPAVLLPEFDPSLPVRDVLIHELAHLRRRDGHWNLLRRLAEAVFFYQPLLWLLARRLEAVAEEVCDDYVVHLGGDRERYARGLVEIAELSLVPAGAASVAMVSLRSILARRITRILDSSRLLSTRVGNLLLVVVIAAGLAGVMAAGFVGLGSQRSLAEAQAADDDAATADDKAGDATSGSGEKEDKAAVAEPKETPAAEDEQAQKQSDGTKAAPANELEGVVAGANGRPVAGAKLYWLRSRVHDIDPQPPQLLATTDKDGRYQFVEPPHVPAETPASWEYMDRIVIVAPGHGFRFTSTEELRREWNDAEGLVPALARALLGGRKGVTSLPRAGDPIRGRLVDVNGQPVAGAKVRIRWFTDKKDQFDGVDEAKARGVENPVWQGRVGNLLNVIEPVQLRDALPSAVSDAEGKFELRDLGVGRLVQLLVEGDGIEATEIVARNEPGEKIVLDINWISAGKSLTVYPNDFLHAVGPSKPVTGRVLDLDSGQPIADAVVRAFQVDGEQVSSSREREHFAVRTDAEGHYRITGLPVGKVNELVAFAAGDAPYLPVARDADTSGPGAELELDFRLKRGLWAEGRVYDAETRKPFTGEISYYFFRDRKLEEAIPGLNEAYVDGLYWTNADGEFRVPVLPTRGILAFRYDGFNREDDGIDRFARGFGADKIAGSEDLGGAKAFPTAPFYLTPANYERIAEVPATDGQKAVRVDMPLFASPPIKVRVVNADGQPASRFQTYGANERWGWQNQDGPQFEIQDLQPGERRKVFVFQRETNLGGGAHVKYGDKEVVEIKLLKCGSVRGRLLDADGEPIDDAQLQVQYEKLQSDDNSAIWAPHRDLRSMPTNIPVDKQGRFRLDGLIPGWSYHAYASAPRELNGQTVSMIIGSPFNDVRIEPGEEKDLGDLTVDADKREPSQPEATDSKANQTKPSKEGTAQKPIDNAAGDRAETTADETAGAERRQLHGRVVDEDGRPIAGARVRLSRIDTERTTWADQGQIVAASQSGADGAFAIECPLSKPVTTREEFISSSNFILADAENHVFDWQRVSPGEPEITLQLSTDDAPIEGRVLDLEGRPIAGVRVGVNEVSGGAKDLDQWVEAAKRNPDTLDETLMMQPIDAKNSQPRPAVARYPGSENLQPGLASLLPSATTDENGSFRLAGLGRDRLVRLELAGSGIAKTWLNVVTRDMPAVPYPDYDPRFRVQTCFGRRFDFTSEPEQPIAGIVRDADSGRPLAGVEVRLNQYADSLLFVEGFLATVTDEQGRYELRGVPKPHDRERSHRLRVVPGANQPYFRTEFRVAKRDGFEPVQGDVKLKRAIWLRGRAIDTATGKPIQGLVEYYPFLSNQAAADYANFEPGMHLMEGDRYATDEDGKFQVPVLPGRGLAAFIALQGDRYPAGDGAEKIADLRQQGGRDLNIYHLSSLDLATAFREINPPSGAAEAVCDFQLKSLDVARIKLVDAEGRPVAGAVAQRLAPYRIGGSHHIGWPQDPLLGATAEIIGPRDQSRTAMFLRREQKLAAAILLTPERAPPETIVLRPAASLSGRIVDREGKPIAGLSMTVSAVPPPGAKQLPGWGRESAYYTHQLAYATTGEDGAFRVDQVPPGLAYVIYARHGAEEATTRVVQPGEKLDLGDVLLQEPKDAKTAQAKAPTRPEPAAVASADETKPAKTKAAEASPKNSGGPTDIGGRNAAAEVEFAGIVTDEDGKPLAGAEIWAAAPAADDRDLAARPAVRRLAESDRQGKFSFRLAPLGREESSDANWTSSVDLIAKAPGHGYDWLPLAVFEKNPAASSERDQLRQRVDKALGEGRFAARTLKLPLEAGPVRGRLIDLEGRPVPDVTVSVEMIWAPDLAILDRAFDTALRDFYYRAINTTWRPSQMGRREWQTLMPAVKTNANGEFSLPGLGRGQMANVTLAGERVAAEHLYIVGREMEAKRIPHLSAKGAEDVFVGVRFTHAVGPGMAISGRVTEFQSGKPIAGARVFVERLFRHDDRIDSAGRLRLDTRHIQAVTDEQGGFRLIGIPPGTGHVLNVAPPKSEPWLMAEQEFSLEAHGAQPAATVNLQVCRGIWIEGRLTDAATGEPAPGYVDYLALQKNPNIPEKLGLHEAWEMSRFPVDRTGRYRVAGLPGPGVLLIRSLGKTVYPLCVGAEQVDGYEQNYLPTTPTGLPLSNWNLIRQIDPPVDAKSYSLDLTLSAGSKVTGRLVLPGGQPAGQVEALGLVPKNPFFGPLVSDQFAVNNYESAVPRDLFFRTADKSLVAHLHLEGKPAADLTVRLQPAVTVKGRLIETETEAEAAGYKLFCESTKQGVFRIDDALTDENGRFEIKGLLAGNVYQLDAANPRHFVNQKNGFTVDLTDAKPGDVLELGDVTGPAAKAKLQTGKNDLQPDHADQGLMAAKSPKDKSPARESNTKFVRGRVTRDGRPTSGADVAVIARNMTARRGGDLGPQGAILAEGKTDEKGEYVLNLSKVSNKSHAYASIIARQVGAAIAWQQLNLETVDSMIDLQLPAEEPIRGKLIDLEGQPAAGVRLTVRGIADSSKNGEASGVSYQGEQVPAAWLAPVVSDEQGRFVVHGAPAAHGVFMEVGPDERFAPQEIDLSPGANEQRGERDATYRPLVKNLKPGEEVVLTISPAQPFAGTVRYADSSKPAPHARISIWASQQERFGSMISVGGRADENGRYQISPKPGVRFGLTAYPPDGVPYLARQTSRDEPLRWNASEGIKQVDLNLPRGVLVQGTIVEAGGDMPVADAAVQYIPESSNNPNASNDVLTGWQAIQLSDKEGRFSIAVLPGPGRLLVSGQQGNYVLQQISELELSDGKPGGARNYAHAIAKLNPEVGQETLEVKLELQPGATASGRIVDEQGQAIEEATVISRLSISPYSLFWRGHTTPTLGGRFELTGLAKDTEYPVYFLDSKRKLGATEIIKAGEGERTVVLKPCGQARLRAVDKSGEPGADRVSVEMVVTPGASRYDFEAARNGELAADSDYVANIDRTNHWNRPQTDDQGTFVLPALIPGATYRVITGRGGTLKVVKEFQVQSNETLDLGEVLIERSE